ncbi:MAG: uroporphyrinogen-III synthase [Gammaproteobacteria bacterium]
MTEQKPLAGIGVLVTRPASQTSGFCERIERSGGSVISFPTIEIQPCEAPTDDLPSVDALIVTSSNAVKYGAQVFDRLAGSNPHSPMIAVGKATAAALRKAGFTVDYVPEIAGSEGILALAMLHDPAIRSTVILRGQESRNLLQEALEKRGIRVTALEVYKRALPTVNTAPLLAAWQNGNIQLVTTHSRAALENLNKLLKTGEKELLHGSQLVVPTTRMIKLCNELKITLSPVVADSAEDDDMFAAVLVAAGRKSGKQEQS